MNSPVLEVEGLHKSYERIVALDGVDLVVEPGEIVGLLGPNGAGKTTLISIGCGLRRPDRGRVFVAGIDAIAQPQRARDHIGLAPQETGIYPMVSVYQNLQLFGELSGWSQVSVRRRIELVVTALGLRDLLERKAGELSGGQKRRLHTAVALLGRPRLILLDEATTGADVETRAGLIEAVGDLSRDGSAVVYSTHYLHEVETLGARVVILEEGRIIAAGHVDELVAGNGGSVVEIDFEGIPPRQLEFVDARVEGSTLRVETKEPGRTVADLLFRLGPEANRVREIEIIRPSLETVYLGLTGRRFREGERSVVAA